MAVCNKEEMVPRLVPARLKGKGLCCLCILISRQKLVTMDALYDCSQFHLRKTFVFMMRVKCYHSLKL